MLVCIGARLISVNQDLLVAGVVILIVAIVFGVPIYCCMVIKEGKANYSHS